MDYSSLLQQLENATAFDLYRLYIAIDKEMTRSERIEKIKKNLRIGMTVGCFDPESNRTVPVRIVELRKTKVLAYDVEKRNHFLYPYFMLNIENVSTQIHPPSEKLSANHLKIGDCVGFSKDGHEINGTVDKLNPKTVGLTDFEGRKWRVAYSLLYRVEDAEAEKLSLTHQ